MGLSLELSGGRCLSSTFGCQCCGELTPPCTLAVSGKEAIIKRQGLSKRLRFEVFKRDSFTCQYCGASAPDVVLQVDHIQPVASDGPSDILNLITSCERCNAGKGAIELGDSSVIKKRKAQADQLQARREQIEMMAEWQRGLLSVEALATQECAEFWRQLAPGFHLNDRGLQDLRDLLRKFGMTAVMEGMTKVVKYLEREDGKITPRSTEIAFSKIGGCCYLQKRAVDDPELHDIYSIRFGILKRASWLNRARVLHDLNELRRLGVPIAELRNVMGSVHNWPTYNAAVEVLSDRYGQ